MTKLTSQVKGSLNITTPGIQIWRIEVSLVWRGVQGFRRVEEAWHCPVSSSQVLDTAGSCWCHPCHPLLFSPSLPHLPSPSSTSLSPLAPSVSVLLPPLVPFPDRVFHCPKAYQDFPHLSFLGTDLFDLGYLVVLKSEPRVTPSKDSIAKQHPNLVKPCILNSHPPTHLVSFLTWWFW